jgi:hypothetical protein
MAANFCTLLESFEIFDRARHSPYAERQPLFARHNSRNSAISTELNVFSGIFRPSPFANTPL